MSSAAAAAMAQGAPKPIPREQLMSLPSLSNSLYSLPNATAMSNIAVHTNFTTTVQHNAEGHAKLQKALQMNAARGSQNAVPLAAHSSSPSAADGAQVMMRKKAKFAL